MIGLAGLLLFGFSAMWLIVAAASDSSFFIAPRPPTFVDHLLLFGVGIGLVLMLVQLGVWLWRLL